MIFSVDVSDSSFPVKGIDLGMSSFMSSGGVNPGLALATAIVMKMTQNKFKGSFNIMTFNILNVLS